MKASKSKMIQKNRIAHARDQQRNQLAFKRKQEIQYQREYASIFKCAGKLFGV